MPMSQSGLVERSRALLEGITPGRWEVRGVQAGDGGLRVEAADKSRGMRAAGDPYPMVCKLPCDYARQHADAMLIAEAPELLVQLCDALDIAIADRDSYAEEIRWLAKQLARVEG